MRITEQFQAGKGVWQGWKLSLYLFNLFAEYIWKEAGLEEDDYGFKTGRRNINNLHYADDTTLTAKTAKNLQAARMKDMEHSGKENGTKWNINETKLMTSGRGLVIPVIFYKSLKSKTERVLMLCCWRRLLRTSWTAKKTVKHQTNKPRVLTWDINDQVQTILLRTHQVKTQLSWKSSNSRKVEGKRKRGWSAARWVVIELVSGIWLLVVSVPFEDLKDESGQRGGWTRWPTRWISTLLIYIYNFKEKLSWRKSRGSLRVNSTLKSHTFNWLCDIIYGLTLWGSVAERK